jgi:hypothetical protein
MSPFSPLGLVSNVLTVLTLWLNGWCM